VLAVGALAFRAHQRHGYAPLCLAYLAAAVVLVAKSWWESNSVMYAAVGLLLIASMWNVWPRRVTVPGAAVRKNKSIRGGILAKKIEVFSAGCSVCKETIEMVRRLAGKHEVVIHDMNKAEVATKAKGYGVRSVPAVVIDGKLASCCAGHGPEQDVLKSALA